MVAHSTLARSAPRKRSLAFLLAAAAAGSAVLQGIAFVTAPVLENGAHLAARTRTQRALLFARGGDDAPAEVAADDDDDEYVFDEADIASMETLKVGQELQGVVMRVLEKGVLVDVGLEKEGFVPASKVSDQRVERIADVVKEGDDVRVWVVEVTNVKNRAQSKLTLSMSKRKVIDQKSLGKQVETTVFQGIDKKQWLVGTVISEVAFGTFVSVPAPDGSGQAQGLIFNAEKKAGAGRLGLLEKIKVRILDVDAATKKMTLSMKEPALDVSVFKGIDPGEWMEGIVVSNNKELGSFVSIAAPSGAGQAEGLCYRTEVKDGGVKVGDKVKVRILEVNTGKNKLSLSMKALPEPLGEKLAPFRTIPQDMWITGIVKGLENFGAFVEITHPDGGATVSGLLHISEIKEEGRVEDVGEEFEIDQEVKVRVKEVTDRGLSLTMKKVPVEKAPPVEPAAPVEQAVVPVEQA